MHHTSLPHKGFSLRYSRSEKVKNPIVLYSDKYFGAYESVFKTQYKNRAVNLFKSFFRNIIEYFLIGIHM